MKRTLGFSVATGGGPNTSAASAMVRVMIRFTALVIVIKQFDGCVFRADHAVKFELTRRGQTREIHAALLVGGCVITDARDRVEKLSQPFAKALAPLPHLATPHLRGELSQGHDDSQRSDDLAGGTNRIPVHVCSSIRRAQNYHGE